MFTRLAGRRLRINSSPRPLLLCMGLLDELTSGLPVVGLPLLRDHLGLSYAQAGFLFTAGALAAILIEPFINLLSDQGSKKPWIMGGLLVLALVEVLMGSVGNYGWLVLTFIIYFPANGAAVGLSQAALIDASPADSARTMTRWTLLSSVGDFLAPLVVAAFVGLNLGWTDLCWFAVALWLLAALLLYRQPLPKIAAEESAEGEEQVHLWVHVRQALHDPLLLRWVALSLLPTMLDEVFLGFVALYLRDDWHLSEALVAMILGLQMLASFLGLFFLDLFLKYRQIKEVPLLAILALFTLLGVVGFLLARVIWLLVLSLCLISLFCAGWYPLTQAKAYAMRPGRSGLVRTISSLGEPFDMALPGVVGLLAGRFGLLTGLLFLGLAPVLLLLLLPYRRPE